MSLATAGDISLQCSVSGEYSPLIGAVTGERFCTIFTQSMLHCHVCVLQHNALAPCDCPCEDLIEVKTPGVWSMTLAYVAQALTVTIVGLNLGFRLCASFKPIFHFNTPCQLPLMHCVYCRKQNTDIWKHRLQTTAGKIFSNGILSSANQVAADGSELVSGSE